MGDTTAGVVGGDVGGDVGGGGTDDVVLDDGLDVDFGTNLRRIIIILRFGAIFNGSVVVGVVVVVVAMVVVVTFAALDDTCCGNLL